MKKIGVIGGVSPESTVLYYKRLIELSHERLAEYEFPEIVIYSLNFNEIVKMMEKEDWKGIAAKLQRVVEWMDSIGVEIGAIASNTMHYVIDKIDSSIDFVNIVDCVANEAERRGFKRVLILGTYKTMKGGLYEEAFRARDIVPVVPDESLMRSVNDLIFEITRGRVPEELTNKVVNAILAMSDEFDAALLGCTELPLVLKGRGFEVLDSVEIHVNEIFERAVRS